MANTISITQKVTCFGLGTLDKTQASKVGLPPTTHHHVRINSNIIKNNRCYVLEHNLGLFIFPSYTTTRKMNMSVFGSLQPGPVDPSSSPAHCRKLWIIGTIFTILLSFSRGKWGPLLQLKEKIETRMKEAEKIAEAVEEVAEGVEKVAEDVAKIVPEGKLHDAAQFVEKVAQDIDKHAQAAEDALEKAKDMEQDLESFFESTTHGQEKSVATTPEWKDQK
ncbi:uncharacterized protein LOC107608250 isoform X1 [Arachis ipaensis]|uniref:uncharacterized protein LOC107608250 isoform X1 n=1 Tax=Arachis ipaensis TaxID=130454 RepID=UPI0007AF403F|nr:uncharacterized protein LOC107608250 isoform X1 [Arachis ipaensis]